MSRPHSSTVSQKPQSLFDLYRQALHDQSLRPSTFRVFCLILDLNLHGTFEIPAPLLAKRSRLSLKTVTDAIAELVNKHYVIRIRQYRRPSLLIVRGGGEEGGASAGGLKQIRFLQRVSIILQKLRAVLLTKEEDFILSSEAVLKEIASRYARIKVPVRSYLYSRARLIHQTAYYLKLNYAKVILAIYLADYYKSVNPDYQILYAGGWIAHIASLPESEIVIPKPFVRYLRERLKEEEKEPDLFEAPPPPPPPPAKPPLRSGGRRPVATNAANGFAYCPRCAARIPDDLGSIREHERTCRVRPGPIGSLCAKCGRFVMDHHDDRIVHDALCGGNRDAR